jgi:hypothetical protein
VCVCVCVCLVAYFFFVCAFTYIYEYLFLCLFVITRITYACIFLPMPLLLSVTLIDLSFVSLEFSNDISHRQE